MSKNDRKKLELDVPNNPDPRCACVLLLDVSSSMNEDKSIDQLNAGLMAFRDDLVEDPLAARRVEVAVTTFSSSVEVKQDFISGKEFTPPELTAEGSTAMGQGILKALSQVRARTSLYRSNGLSLYVPWIFMITDGYPTDEWKEAAQQVKEASEKKDVVFFAVGVKDADMDILAQISPNSFKLDEKKFRELFVWLSRSLRSVSGSAPGGQVALENTAPFTIDT